ncbi:dTDP-4-dehydrorhamnose 3,5-epimerase, partial [bacterium]|nr:dTDP-4-dehydrorhamnose 3,5-epimerase [bacterium]
SKMVSVLEGEVLDVVVDLREESKTYGKTYSVRLSRENKRQLFIPRRFAHGFVVLSETALFFYKCDNLYNKASEGGILFNDPILNIDWEIDLKDAILSGKDMELPHFGHHRIP